MSNKNNRFTNASQFWVIFDTCQLPPYYQDVHNLLALPAGAIIRYDYRTRYISDDALAAVKGTATAPRNVLLIYLQHEKYKRAAGPEYRPAPGEGLFVVATRFGRMRLTPNLGGDKYAFDLELEGYPKLVEDVVRAILRPLADANQAPWSKWVTVSPLVNKLEELKSGQDRDNWAAIVAYLGQQPSQFKGDFFWRVAPPILGGKKSIVPTFETQSATAPGGMRQVSFSYPLQEGHRCEFEVFSHVTHALADHDGNPGSMRRLRVGVKDPGPLQYDGSSPLDLRYDTATRVAVTGQRAETVDDRFGLLTLDSGEPVDTWPIGPRLTFQFRVFKSKVATVIGTLLWIAATVLGVCADQLWKENLVLGITCALGTTCCVIIGSLLITRKIGAKL